MLNCGRLHSLKPPPPVAFVRSRPNSPLTLYVDVLEREREREREIFIAMQPVKVEMIQDNYTTLQNTK